MRSIVIFIFLFLHLVTCYGQAAIIYTSNDIDDFPIIERIDCQEPGSEECFQEQIAEHIKKTFQYPKKELRKRITGKAYVRFVLDTEGRISEVKARSNNKNFEEEAIRIFSNLKIKKPAKAEGTAVSFSYNWPIVFNIKTDDVPANLGLLSTKYVTSTNSILAFDRAGTPPKFKGCDGKTDLRKCMLDLLTAQIINSPKMQQKRSNDEIIDCTVYFEINSDKSISNIVLISNNQTAKSILESYLNGNLIVGTPAFDENQNPITTYFDGKLLLKAVTRARKQNK